MSPYISPPSIINVSAILKLPLDSPIQAPTIMSADHMTLLIGEPSSVSSLRRQKAYGVIPDERQDAVDLHQHQVIVGAERSRAGHANRGHDQRSGLVSKGG